MKITSSTLRRLANLQPEALIEALVFLAEQLECQEEVERMTEQSRQLARDRQSRWRLKNAKNTSQSQKSDVAETPSRAVDITKTLNSKGLDKTKPPVVPHFEEFWAVYPKRAGNQDKGLALKAWPSALKRASPDEIINGARAYAAFCAATSKTGTEYVRQARTWLNQSNWTEDYNAANLRNNSPNTIAGSSSTLDTILDGERRAIAAEAASIGLDLSSEGPCDGNIEALPRLRENAA